MPQPATHYLATRFAIPKDHYDSWDCFKSYYALGSTAPDLFYFPLIPKLVNNPLEIHWEGLANPLHSNSSYDMFCALLDIAKKNNSKKMFAFAFGYYCHVVTDCIFHPYVYRSTGDYWHTENTVAETKHKFEPPTTKVAGFLLH